MTTRQTERARGGDPLTLVLGALGAPRRFVRPWYLAYLLLGMVTAGLLPVLLPLAVEAQSHSLAAVAYVLGAYNFGLLSSPLWGMSAERTGAHRRLFIGSFLLTGTGIAALLLFTTLPLWLAGAFAAGAGSGGAATLATLFVIDFAPQAEWEARIGWLQSFNAAGEVFGLIAAAGVSSGEFSPALWGAAALVVVAAALGGIGLPVRTTGTAGSHRPPVHALLDIRALARFPRLSRPAGIGLHVEWLNLRGLRRVPGTLGTPFGRFLMSWFAFAFAVAAFFSYFPLMLAHRYGIDTRASALLYAAAAAVGIALYILTGRLTARYGADRIYRLGLWMRIVGFALLLAPFLPQVGGRAVLGAVGFMVLVIAWPLLSVAGTDLGASLTPFSEGAAVGLLNAALALATALGIVCSGPLVAHWGYVSIPVMALAGLLIALLLDRAPRPPAAAPR